MIRVVLDSSAVLAVVYEERGAAKVVDLLGSGEVEPLISAVNLCEVQTRLVRDGVPVDQVLAVLSDFDLTVVPLERRRRRLQVLCIREPRRWDYRSATAPVWL